MSALQQFVSDELDRRKWSVPEFARRAEISTSLAYQIIDGKDNVRRNTFDKIASAFDLTPAQLADAIGRDGALSPEHASVIATYESIPKDKRSVWLDIGVGSISLPHDHQLLLIRQPTPLLSRASRPSARCEPTGATKAIQLMTTR